MSSGLRPTHSKHIQSDKAEIISRGTKSSYRSHSEMSDVDASKQAGSRAKELLADAGDFYNRRLQHWVPATVFVWLAFFVWRIATEQTASSEQLVSVARDSGLQMSLTSPLNQWALSVHSWSGVALLLCCLLQKQLVVSMSQMHSFPSSLWHRRIGLAAVALMLVMALAGFASGLTSAWDNFTLFSVFFAAPWLLWAVAIYVTAKRRVWNFHRLFANQALKGCLTVPTARLCGAWVQRTFPNLGQANGYYLGIFFVTLFVMVWEMVDLYQFAIAPCAVSAEERRNRAKGK